MVMRTMAVMEWRRVTWRLAVSAAVSSFVLGLMFRLWLSGQASEGAATLYTALRDASRPLLGMYLILALVQTTLRALRNSVLLKAGGEARVPPMGHLTLVSLTRNMFSDLLPARLGELSYVALLNRLYGVRAEVCVSSLAVSMVFDLVALLLLVAGGVSVQLVAAAPTPALTYSAIALLAIVAIAFAVLFRGIGFISTASRRLATRMKNARLLARPLDFLDRLAGALELTRASGVLSITLLLSLALRLTKYAALYMAFQATARAAFPTLAAASPFQVLSTLLIAEATASLPIPTFMSFGSYEAGGVLLLTTLGFSAAEGALCMLATHICSQTIDYSLGGVGLLLVTLCAPATKRAPSPGPRLRSARRWAPAGAALLIMAGAAVMLTHAYINFRRAGALAPAPPGKTVQADEWDLSKAGQLVKGRVGFIVWSSNRSGNHELYQMALPGFTTRQLTRNDHVDYFPRISSDGKRLVFARSQARWVSVRNERPWDLYILDLESGREALLAKEANMPAWSGPDSVVFQRAGNQAIERDLKTGKEVVIVAAGTGGVPDAESLSSPSYWREAGQTAITIRGGARMTAVAGPGTAFLKVGGGCQITWSPDHSFLYYTDEGGKMENAFFTFNPKSGERRMLLDTPGDLSHEYFPKLSSDGSFLVFAASAGEHEHDTADYEIFLWRVGSAPADAVRMTYHTGNDFWPDIYLAPGT